MNIGDEVLIRLRDGLDPRLFGSSWRIGIVKATGFDILADEPMITLDDGGPNIYESHIDFVSYLRTDDAEPLAVEPVERDAR